MKIHVNRGVEHSFGEALNAWLWPDLFPSLF